MKERTLLFSVTLKDCDVETKRGKGNGGQNRNKRDTAVRIVHKDSGAVGESEEERSQYQNKRAAFTRMVQTPVFQTWLKRESALRSGMPTPEQLVEKQWKPEFIKTEVKEAGRWQEIPTKM